MDEIDELLDQAWNNDAGSEASEAGQEDGAAATAPTVEAATSTTPAPTEEPPIQSAPSEATPPTSEAAPVTAEAPESTTPSPQPTDDATLAELRRNLQATQQQLEQMRRAQIEAAEQERFARLQAEWSQMPEAERARSQADFVMLEAARRVQEAEGKLAERDAVAARIAEAQRAEAAKPQAIEKIASHFGLPKDEWEILEDLADPVSMAVVAKKRAEQLARVKDTRRDAVSQNLALTTQAAGTGSSTRPLPTDFENVDQLLDHVFGVAAPG